MEVICQTAASLLHVSTCLDKGQRQSVHLLNDVFGSSTILVPRLVERGIHVQQFAPAQQQQGTLLRAQLLHFDAGSDCARRLSASSEQDISLVAGGQELLRQGQVVGIVQDEQPAFVGSQPALDGGNHPWLILLIFFHEIELFSQCHKVGGECLSGGRPHPEHRDVFVAVAKGVFGSSLCFADAA